MASIGFRCWKDRLAFVVLDGSVSNPVLVDHGNGVAPRDVGRPDVLAWLRREVHEVLDANVGISTGFFRAAEKNSRARMDGRYEFEGVLQEAAFSHQLNLGLVARIKSQIKRDTGFAGPQSELGQLVTHPALASLAANTYEDAVLAALCGLPGGS